MKTRLGVFLLAVFSHLSISPLAEAQWLKNGDGNELLEMCRIVVEVPQPEGNQFTQAAACFAFLEGVRQGHFWTLATLGSRKYGFCAPNSVTNGQKVRVVVKYLTDRPEGLHRPAGVLILDAFKEAFPCPSE